MICHREAYEYRAICIKIRRPALVRPLRGPALAASTKEPTLAGSSKSALMR